ncbi:cupin domain-containing protein [Paracoccus sp. WLY502]|uniref:cupin domain-containing protein n=1 Tax=Paracoccus yibinensis TaxID=3068891 RepID=UPI002796868D|nr:cupin domain-containing protein [Paracoccus sp. WLY502]MDQ1902151.1 cupin domain-containing protein [Paracoccus sp. WLY502]
MPDVVTLSPEDSRKRHVRRDDMVPERVAFIDCKMPGSHLKENYSLIGPGVTQSKEQKVCLSEPHGFSLGVAAMPAGITNNLHVHYTAEVFMIYKGTWLFRWGADGKDGEIIGNPGDIVSIPTWIFRGFSNVGDGDGWIFTALGGDDTGGILWHPRILEVAAEHGLYLTRDNMMVDTQKGQPKPGPDELLEPMTREQIDSLPKYSIEDMRRNIVTKAERNFAPALLDSHLPGHGAEIAPVAGHGISQNRDHVPPITYPQGLSLEWGRIPQGGMIGRHLLHEKQVMIVFSGTVEVAQNEGAETVTQTVASQELYSFPADTWREIRNVGTELAEFVLITAGDHKKRIVWSEEIQQAAAKAGYAIDHNGYVAPLDLLPYKVRNRFGH